MDEIVINHELKKIGISNNEGILFKNIADLIYCESDENYSRLHFIGEEKILISKTLKDLESVLKPFNIFFRIHKKSLVNLNYISQYKKVNGSFVLILENNTKLDVACRRRNDFLKQIPRV